MVREGFLREVALEKKPDDHLLIFVEYMNEQEGDSHGNIWRRNILGRGNSQCKDLQLAMTLAYLKTRESIVSRMSGQQESQGNQGLVGQVKELGFILSAKGTIGRVT